jgi:subtilisin family serine protease
MGSVVGKDNGVVFAKQSDLSGPVASQPNEQTNGPLAGPLGLPDVEGGYATTHIFVRVKQGVAPSTMRDGRQTFAPIAGGKGTLTSASQATARALAQAKAIRTKAFFAGLKDQATVQRLGMDRVYQIDVPAGTDTPALVRKLAPLTTMFEYVELDGIGGLAGSVPNDPQFSSQYAMHNTGQTIDGTPGVADADLDAPEAWTLAAARSLDTSTVSIAVLDSGVNQHVQLAGRILPGFNIPDNNTITVDECQSHGTHVSGIIAASGNDAVGTAGLAWAAKIAPYVVVNPCTGFESSVATALTMATDAGYRLVNMSLQYYTGTMTLQNAVQYAYSNDVIMVAAAGNNNNSFIAFPGRWPETICVAATTNTDAKASFSNFGPEVDLCAGGNVIRSLIGTTTYGDKNGTSQATPAVTGTIALMLAWNPNLTPEEVRQILIDTAVDIGPAGFDNSFGYGRVNAYAALLATPSGLPQDLDNDGLVGASDLAIVLGAWGPCSNCDACAADFDGDCTVGASDIAILLGAWG